MNPFVRLTVQYRATGGTLIRWEMDPLFHEPGPYQFTVQAGYAPNDDSMQQVGPVLVDAMGVTVEDDIKRLYGQDLNLWYRVILETASSSYTSLPEQAGSALSKRDWLTYRKMCSDFWLLAGGFGGTPGRLFKRRIFGTPCPGRAKGNDKFAPCRDWDTDQIVDSDCPNCFGVGRLGGYYPPITCPVIDPSKARKIVIDETRGSTDDVIIQVVAPAFANPSPKDVWAACDSDERYIIETSVASDKMRGIPVSYNLGMRLAPFTDPIYRIDLTALSGYAGGYGTA